LAACGSSTAPQSPTTHASDSAAATALAAEELETLEQQHHARLGAYAIDTVTGTTVAYRANERFPMDSSFKGLACGALLHQHPLGSGYFDQLVHYTQHDVLAYAPITGQHVDTGMTISQLCDAAITLSDNTAGNLVLYQLGGPAGWTAVMRALGDPISRLDRWETDLNTSIPGDPRDTTTPAAETADYRTLVLGPALGEPERTQLTNWLFGNKIGNNRIRAGVPTDWKIADKTGTGTGYGSAVDVGVLWPPHDGHPIALGILTTHDTHDAIADNALIAAAAKIVVTALH
jgi:beta-lactamase class A